MEELIIRDQFYHLFSIVVDTWDHGTFLPMIGDHYYQNWRGNGSEGRRLEEFLFCNVATFCSTVDRYNENEGNPGVAELGLVGQIVNCYANVETIGICWLFGGWETCKPQTHSLVRPIRYTGSCTLITEAIPVSPSLEPGLQLRKPSVCLLHQGSIQWPTSSPHLHTNPPPTATSRNHQPEVSINNSKQ